MGKWSQYAHGLAASVSLVGNKINPVAAGQYHITPPLAGVEHGRDEQVGAEQVLVVVRFN